METQPGDQGILHDLALIYISLAHSTDQQLSEEEIRSIAERLRSWQDVKTETVLSAFKEALDDYTQEGTQERLNQAVLAVRDAMPQNLRQFIVDDLMDIALSDGKFLYNEGSFIGELARAWEVHASDELPEGGNSWSILNNGDRQDGWTPVHDLALIYITLAHSTDGDLHTSEVEAIARKLGEWLPDAGEDEVLNLVQEALRVYAQGPDERVFTESVEAVKQYVPTHQRPALLADLNYIAGADGRLLEEEQTLIRQLSQAWDVTPEA